MANFVARTILEQLGGNRFIALASGKPTNSRAPVINRLRFRIGRNAKGVNIVAIRLDASDTYTLEFWRITVRRATLKASVSGVYCDNLQAVFSEHTGMATKF